VAQCLAMASGPVVEYARTLAESLILPAWAPNLHPLIVHFPIAWLIAALVVDLVSLLLPRAAWASATAACLYPAGALSAVVAYLTGRQAAANVLLPGMAQPVMVEHWNWALATTVYFTAIAAIRLVLTVKQRHPAFWMRAATVAIAFGGMLLLFHTGEQGARLVYEHGVGVVPRTHGATAPNTR
jgi:uncharacterized membrane protein